jgi:protein LSM14
LPGNTFSSSLIPVSFLGKRISLVSKKNIRYEGVLYSINEQNATVALQNVKTFGTEGRELAEEGCIFVAPTDTVHPYLLFRGQDIKDLHVHEQPAEEQPTQTTETSPAAPVIEAPKPPDATAKPPPPQPNNPTKTPQSTQPGPTKTASENAGRGGEGRGSNNNRRARNSKAAPGTGASLLNRTARGVVGDTATPQEDFDFQSSLEKFKEQSDDNDEPYAETAYEKDDFFDSISCDALDKQSGMDNRLKGAEERRLNTETFGAVALNTQSRRRGGVGGRGGRGRGGREGRGSNTGRGRGGRGFRAGGRGRGRGRSVASE